VQGIGDNTTLARLQIIDTRLIVEANSAARFASARKWIEALSGVEFERVTTQEIRPGALRPLDDRLPGQEKEPSPEVIEHVREFLLESYRSWLDQPIPMLNGQSPRQACKTPGGRRRVAAMIRTMPAATGPGGAVEPPREELLRELGIASS